MVITDVAPARLPNGAASNDLEDLTHGCIKCGSQVIRTVRSLSSVA
jgi:hypothetical protein